MPPMPKTATPTLDEVRRWPATVPVVDAARALGIGKSTAYNLIAAGEFPVRLITAGTARRVITASLVAVLEGA